MRQIGLTGASIACYPVLAALESPIWPVAALAAAICVAAAIHRGVAPARVAAGIDEAGLGPLLGPLAADG